MAALGVDADALAPARSSAPRASSSEAGARTPDARESDADADADVDGEDAGDGEGVGSDDDADADAPDGAADDAELQAAIARIRADPHLPAPAVPKPPDLSKHAKLADKARAIQAFIERLQYNHTGVDYNDLRRDRPIARLLESARAIVARALPIKCVEAVFVSLLLTQGLSELERFPLSFRSKVNGQTAKHIVLALRQPGVGWGALGLSRRLELYYYALGSHPSLAELYDTFRGAYAGVGHRLARVRIGLPVPHDSFSTERVCWVYRTIDVRGDARQGDVRAQLNAFSKSAPKLAHAWRSSGAGGAGSERAEAAAASAAGTNAAAAKDAAGSGKPTLAASPARASSRGRRGKGGEAAAGEAGMADGKPPAPVGLPVSARVAASHLRV
jgi:hypothetical protein